MHRLFRKRKVVAYVTLLFVAMLLLTVLIIGFIRHQQAGIDTHPLSDPTVGFQMYVPSMLPEDFRITGKRISVRHASFYDREKGDSHKLAQVSVEMNLRSGNWVYSIDERRAGDQDKTEIKTVLTNYDPASTKPTCIQGNSPKGQEYRLCHWTEYDRISVFEVKFIKGNTYIDTTFPSTLDKSISINEFDEYVDSFKPGNPEGLPMLVDTM